MSRDDYLWDRRGQLDDEVAGLEDLLGELRYRRPMPAIDARFLSPCGARPLVAAAEVERAVQRARQRPWSMLMVAAGFALVCGAWILRASEGTPTPMAYLPHPAMPAQPLGASDDPGWAVTVLRGTPTCDGAPIAGDDPKNLQVGRWLETGPGDEARVAVADIGELSLRPDSRMKLVATDDVHRVSLERGRLHAFVDAPPRVFLVDTPAATAVDLGCEYEIDVRPDGSVGLRVDLGWVALEGKSGMPTYVPAGFRAETDARGTGLPIRSAAPEALVRAVSGYQRGGSLGAVMDASGADDIPTLWHALVRSDDPEKVYERMRALGAEEAEETARVLARDTSALTSWGQRLGVIPPPGWPNTPVESDQAPPVWTPPPLDDEAPDPGRGKVWEP